MLLFRTAFISVENSYFYASGWAVVTGWEESSMDAEG
jgi:hypothetical protein